MPLINRVSRAQTVITITESAKTKIKDLLLEENNPNLALRTFVQGGGCSGFQYGFTFDDVMNEDDFEIPLDEHKVLVDAMSMQYLTGAVIDYKEDLMGSSFSIKNPNATTTCGCGSSFGV
jgi:iron-sulfur cluster insertion protein